MNVIQNLLLVISSASLSLILIGYLILLFRLMTKARRQHEGEGVSILKPIKGADEGLRENLQAILDQEYNDFEVIFAAEDFDDPGLEIAREVARANPHHQVQVLSGSFGRGQNPKVRLLRRMVPEAQYDWILVSDSNVRPGRHYLAELRARQVETGAALVHSLLTGRAGHSVGARIEELHLCTWVAMSICFSDALAHQCVIGKSMFMQREALADVGGFEGVQDILAEDYILGSRFQAAGHRVALCYQPLPVMTGRSSWKTFWNRHVRWGQMRRRISPISFAAELFANPVLFLSALVLSSQGQVLLAALAGFFLKWTVEALVYRRLAREASAETILLLPLRDALVAAMWSVSAVRRTVAWRGHRMRVGPGSRLLPLDDFSGSEPHLGQQTAA